MPNTPTGTENLSPVSTWDALRELGFEADSSVRSEDGAGLSIDLGKFRLSAGRVMNQRFTHVIDLGGVYASSRTIGTVEFEMPLTVESTEQCAAWIAWHLRRQLPATERALSLPKAAIVFLGFKHQDTLPWVRNAAAYDSRPQCMVSRTWMRQALRQLASNLGSLSPADTVVLAFDGQVFSFSAATWAVPVPADGLAWPHRYGVPVANLLRLPARLTNEQVQVSVWEGGLFIGNRKFDGVAVIGPLDSQGAETADSTSSSRP
jgi:hypothetical protein